MITVKKEGIILKHTNIPFENDAVLNPAVIQEGNTVHIFYRAVKKGNYSSIGYCKLQGPLEVIERNDKPILSPKFDYESHGVEDPRITKIDELFYLSYTAYDGINASGALATSSDLKYFERKGIITPIITYIEFKRLSECNTDINIKYHRYHNHIAENNNIRQSFLWDKNLIFFPRRINEKIYFLHRIRPDIQIASVNEIEELNKVYWENYLLHLDEHIILSSKYDHEISYIGGGCPPIETEEGWLIIYHGVHDTTNGYVYTACAALLDLHNPNIELARLPYPLFKPEHEWELTGEVNNVVFPTGTSLFNDTLYIYYGAADKCIAVASVSFKKLIHELKNRKLSNEK